ncbi:FtsQ-type POTRA domain-containing protein, partial [bacterium M00.F.Ca.ET.179.01.1.1]
VVQGITARTGFAVDQIKVVGNRQTSEIDVLDRLGLDGWTSLIGFDAEAARERIATLPWDEGAAVRKIYPHTLEVRIEEREAFALWQQGASESVIEKSRA